MPDLESQLQRYGDVLRRLTTPVDRPTADDATTGPMSRPHRHLPPARTLLAVAAALVLVVGLVAVAQLGNSASVRTADRSGGAPMPFVTPRLVPGLLPVGMHPVLTEELPSGGADSHAQSVQTFRVPTGGGAAGAMTLVIEGVEDSTSLDTNKVTIAGSPAVFSEGQATVIAWQPPRASVIITGQALDSGELLTAADTLRARSAEPMEGFDIAPGANAPTLVAEHLTAPNDPSPAVSRVWYARAGEDVPSLMVEAVAPTPGAPVTLDLLTTSEARRAIIAGAERVVSSSTVSGWKTVAWLQPDGTTVAVQGHALSDADLAAAVGHLIAADSTTWQSLVDQTAAWVAHRPTVATIPLDNGTLVVHGGAVGLWAHGTEPIGNAPAGSSSFVGVCLTPTHARTTCRPLLAIRTMGPAVAGPSGWAPIQPVDASSTIVSTLIDGTWWVFGTTTNLGTTIQPDVGRAHVVTDRGDGSLVFAASLPDDARRADVLVEPMASTPTTDSTSASSAAPFALSRLVRPNP
jgi:hypothetical protein